MVSYPTVRIRLDRLIEKVKVLDEHAGMGQFERILRAQHADGKIDMNTLKVLLAAHKQEMEARNGKVDGGSQPDVPGSGAGRGNAPGDPLG